MTENQWAELRQVGFATLDHTAAVRTATELLELGPGFDDPLPQTALIAELDQWFAGLNTAEAMARLEPADCCAAPVLDLAEALKTEQIQARGLVRRGADGAWQALFPARIDGEAPALRAPLKEI